MGFSFRKYEFKIVWSPHVIFKHRVISVIKTLLVFRIKLCMLEFDQKYFIKNALWKKHLLISKQQEDKEQTCFIQRWDVIQKQNAEWQNP